MVKDESKIINNFDNIQKPTFNFIDEIIDKNHHKEFFSDEQYQWKGVDDNKYSLEITNWALEDAQNRKKQNNIKRNLMILHLIIILMNTNNTLIDFHKQK
ncbi:hypothetical protein NW731_04200 [Mycoplasmopsis felis]|uniref:hypothetical protein n=1 Tax=Mycoplasmopsis felis TaxID=33923 RepID=UPI0021DF683C|nr:hypothetical protein [Mycoplasmopsis felis]MCU9937629.1 hypothetical protein [Mycoplasmopsis felis]